MADSMSITEVYSVIAAEIVKDPANTRVVVRTSEGTERVLDNAAVLNAG